VTVLEVRHNTQRVQILLGTIRRQVSDTGHVGEHTAIGTCALSPEEMEALTLQLDETEKAALMDVRGVGEWIDTTPDEAMSMVDRIRAKLVDDDDIDSLPDPVPLVEGWLSLDSLACLYGPPGLGKSFIAVDLAYRLRFGDAWFDGATTAGTVLYVSAEGRAGLKQRRAAWLEGYGRGRPLPTDRRVVWHPDTINMLSATTVDALATVAAELRPVLIVLDTMARTSPGGDEGGESTSSYVAGMDRLRTATGACVMVVHHTGKDTTRGARGHSSLEGAMDTMLEVDGSRTTGQLTLKATKQKDMPTGREINLVRSTTGDSCTISIDRRSNSDEGMKATERTALDAFIGIALEDGVTASEWMKSLPEGAMSPRTFYRARATLIDTDKVRKVGSRYVLGNLETTGE
jgi:hypothetical protein